MTTQLPGYRSAAVRTGCEVCHSQQTVTIDGVGGRRCAEHPTTFDAAHAVAIARDLGMAASMSYIRTPLAGDAA